MRRQFNTKDLIVLEKQYTVIHKESACFKKGEIVFLKSSPNIQMVVAGVGSRIYCFIKNDLSNTLYSFSFGIILQYKYAPLVTYKRDFKICLN